MIVLVEDDDAIREITAAWLRAEGHEVAAFADPYDALHAIRRSGSVDLVVTDLCLPRMRGEQFAALARLLMGRPELPVIGMSGLYASRSEAPEETRSKVDLYLPKPFGGQLLARAVRTLLPAAGPQLVSA